MAILGRALLLAFPQHADLFNIGAMKLGEQVIPTHNGLIGRYPGADGMKTGFTCPAGFNLVASATREGRKVIVVVMGDSVRAHSHRACRRTCWTSAFADSATRRSRQRSAVGRRRAARHARRNLRPAQRKAQLEAETEDFGAAISVRRPDLRRRRPATAP